MPRSGLRLSRPLYEGLPWIYVACGLSALVGSYVSAAYTAVSLAIGLLGILGLLAGIVVLLRRRDYREIRSHYGNTDSSLRDLDKE